MFKEMKEKSFHTSNQNMLKENSSLLQMIPDNEKPLNLSEMNFSFSIEIGDEPLRGENFMLS
jgi:hypothetical protein